MNAREINDLRLEYYRQRTGWREQASIRRAMDWIRSNANKSITQESVGQVKLPVNMTRPGYHNGQVAFAVGASHSIDDGNSLIRATASVDANGGASVGAGIGWHF